MSNENSKLPEEVIEYQLEKYALELETDGLTIVPPEVTGISEEFIDACVEVLLEKFTEMTGCPISLANGPEAELEWPEGENNLLAGAGAPDPTQMLIQQLLQVDRHFRDLCVNPVVDALINLMMGELSFPSGRGIYSRAKNRRLSSTNSFIKWQGDYGYGENLGLHCDQGANPLPWGHTALTANATWCLTDYTEEDGALAYVPGSHKSNAHPGPTARNQAVPAVCPKGSVIVWPGSTWHGAYPKKTPGLRLNAVAYYRHQAVLPQENLSVTMKNEPWSDCDNPDLLKELIGFDDKFPYLEQTQSIPKVAAAS